MGRHYHLLLAVSLFILFLFSRASSAQVRSPDVSTDEPPAAAADAPENPAAPSALREIEGEPVQRGPVHEAYAEPLALTPEPGLAVPKEPPAPIEEIAPEINDDDANLVWIPGYWAWDEQPRDFVWVSGVWRRAPKGRHWQRGYWREVDGGYQWVPGAWLKSGGVGTEEVAQQEVLPVPPESLEEGPTGPAPSQDHFWVPGVWRRNDDRYAWRPGFWSSAYENWVWVPDHYAWTPDGCVYVPGYWDYPWERRGWLYAPCRFTALDLIGNVYYRPVRIINTSGWLSSLWVRPGCRHYYYGDYYDYGHLGYSPWYSYYHHRPHYWDPLYTHYRWAFTLGFGSSLYSHLHGLHGTYARHGHLRPTVRHHRHEERSHFARHDYATAFGRERDRSFRFDRDRANFRDRDRRISDDDVRDLVRQRRRDRDNEDQRPGRDRLADGSESGDRLGTSAESGNRLNTRSRFPNRLNTRSENGNRLAGGPGANRRAGDDPAGTASQSNGTDSDASAGSRARAARDAANRLRGTLDREDRNGRSSRDDVVGRRRDQQGPSQSAPSVNRSASDLLRPRPDSQTSSRRPSPDAVDRLRGTLDRKTRSDRSLGSPVLQRDQPSRASRSAPPAGRSANDLSRSRQGPQASSRRPPQDTIDRARGTLDRKSRVDPRPNMARSAARSATQMRAGPAVSRPTPRPSPARSGPRPSISRSRPSPAVSSSRPNVARPTARATARPSRPSVARPTPRASGRSSPPPGMRNARGAHLARQRAATNARKGRD